MAIAVCLDTTFLVDLLAGEPAATRLSETLEGPVVVSAISVYELLFSARTTRQREAVEALAADYGVVPADYAACALAAALQGRLREEGRLIPVLDALIAATAILTEAALVTADEHFDRIPAEAGLRVVGY